MATVRKIKSPQSFRVVSNAYPRTYRDWLGKTLVFRNPEGPFAAKIYAIKLAINFKGLGKATRPAQEIAIRAVRSIKSHVRETVEWFQRTNEDCIANVFTGAGDIQHE
jgi:hypothetical protein